MPTDFTNHGDPRISSLLVKRRPPPSSIRKSTAVWHWQAVCVPVVWLSMGTAVWSQDGQLQLKNSWTLTPRLTDEALADAPLFIQGELVEGSSNSVLRVQGDALVRRHDLVVKADELTFNQDTKELNAQGNVLINRNGDRFTGASLFINADQHSGLFLKAEYSLLLNDSRGDAERVTFVDRDNTDIESARYSTCPRPPGEHWLPAWMLRSDRLQLDNVEEVGTARGTVVEFQGIPILATPWLEFPLSSKRKSGLLPPTINIDNISGVELTLPWYWNIAPNQDATFSPTVMSDRGVDYAAEYRYLTPESGGELRAAYMPNDRLRAGDERWGLSYQHNHALPVGDALHDWGLGGQARARWKLNRVSDDNYWRDFPRTSTTLTSRLLSNEGEISWSRDAWQFSGLVNEWQTLQDPVEQIVSPYNRVPSLALKYDRNDLAWAGVRGWNASLYTEWTRFERRRLSNLSTDVPENGDRSVAVLHLGHDLQAPGWFFKPKVQWHATRYQLDEPINGQMIITKGLPTASLDTGLVFERDSRWGDDDYLLTLEPRAFLTWTPYQNQINPIYDTALKEFNMSSIFSENTWGGNDRLSDTRALTLGLSTRYLRAHDGAELLRLGVAQRLTIEDCVGETGCPQTKSQSLSDILVEANVRWDDRWAAELSAQLDQDTQETRRSVAAARYSPSNFRTLSASYRYQNPKVVDAANPETEHLDFGWQWPISDLWGAGAKDEGPGRGLGVGRWYSVGKVNYSMTEKTVVDLIAGFEYDAGCWVGRFVTEQLKRGSEQTNTRYMFQLEFVGFSRLGVSPLKSLRDSIPRYQYLREQVNPPSRFQQYD
jgi:LPS-assembly protein